MKNIKKLVNIYLINSLFIDKYKYYYDFIIILLYFYINIILYMNRLE